VRKDTPDEIAGVPASAVSSGHGAEDASKAEKVEPIRPMLTIENLHVYYANVHALKGVSLDVHEGELVSVIGSNGAGKSTLLRTLSGLLRPRSGTIAYKGQSITGLEPHKIVSLGISHCPEGRHLFAPLTVTENLMMGAFQTKDAADLRRSEEQVFELFPVLAARRSQRAGTLSGGEQQMLAIGRALMAQPDLLVLDEPSLGLAPMLVTRIFEALTELQQRGVTILLVEQNARMALEIADRGYVLELGQVVLMGSGAELVHNKAIITAYLGG
jgi:branched-chain amino acid transport system ATP-binding protein